MTKQTIKGGPSAVLAILKEADNQAQAAGLPRNPASNDDRPANTRKVKTRAKNAFIRTTESLHKDIVKECAELDTSDTDNAVRLLKHFGDDLLVVSQKKAKRPAYAVWDGTHWDIDTGDPRSQAIAQQLGDRIMLEAEHLILTPPEQVVVDRAKGALEVPEEQRSAVEKRLAKSAEDALDNLAKRRKRRNDHAVSSKNKAKLEAMLSCAAPHTMRNPDAFNADLMKVAVQEHTLRFEKRYGQDGPQAIIEAEEGHSRADLITQIVPVSYDDEAQCPKWCAFMNRMLPDDDVRRLVQVASGLGLVGLTVQKLFFHYGFGANGKSVYMETLCRILGEAAVTLPSESFIGEGKGGGAASPDMARLYGRRFLRVKELPEGEDLRENLVKDLTGGEDFTVRDLFEGYFDFKPIFTGHMSGNGYPRIRGTDNGIWRRLVVVHWPVTLAPSEQREFEDVLADFEPEYSGILNWLIEGVLIFLQEGLVIPESVKKKTQEYRDEMDPTAAFCAQCVEPDDNSKVSAKDFYQGYVDYTIDQGGKPISLTRFGLIMKKKFRKEEGRAVQYLGLRLVDVPRTTDRSSSGQYDYEEHMR